LIIFEFISIFVMLPLAASFIDMPFYLILSPMLVAFVYSVWWLFFCQKMRWKYLLRSESLVIDKKQLKIISLRFIVCVILLTGLVLQLYPDKFLNFPLQHPLLFLGFIFLYPILSVLPQELLYRTFFFERYQTIFRKPKIMILASAITFSFLHIIYHNYDSVLLTLIGGYFFSQSYRATRSLLIVCIEHSLYGVLVFTLGFGGFFIRGLKEVGLVL